MLNIAIFSGDILMFYDTASMFFVISILSSISIRRIKTIYYPLTVSMSNTALKAVPAKNSPLGSVVVVKLNWPRFYSLASTFSLTHLVSNRHYVDAA